MSSQVAIRYRSRSSNKSNLVYDGRWSTHGISLGERCPAYGNLVVSYLTRLQNHFFGEIQGPLGVCSRLTTLLAISASDGAVVGKAVDSQRGDFAQCAYPHRLRTYPKPLPNRRPVMHPKVSPHTPSPDVMYPPPSICSSPHISSQENTILAKIQARRT